MRKKGTGFVYEEEMAADCARIFRKTLAESPASCTIAEVAALAVKKPTTRFWVNELRAYRMACAIRRHGESATYGMMPMKRKLYHEIYERSIKSRRKHESLKDAVYRVCENSAPRMYMTPGTLLNKLSLWRKRYGNL